MAIETGAIPVRPDPGSRIPSPARTAAMPIADRAAVFGTLYDRVLPGLYAFVATRVPDRTAAEEVTQRIFERGATVVRDIDATESLSAFLHGVATSAVFDHVRRSRGNLPRDVRASDFAVPGDRARIAEIVNAGAAAAMAASIDRIALRRAVGRIPDQELHVLLLRYLDGFGPPELAAALGCPEADVAARTERAMEALQSFLLLERRDPFRGLVHVDGPIETATDRDADLALLDAELRAAGAQARLALRGTTQPTRWFAQHLRRTLLAAVATPVGPPTPR